MNEQPTPNFPGIGAPATDFFAVRANLRTPPLYTSIDLTSARAKSANTQQVLTLTGNFIYCDPAVSTGVATGYFVGLDNNATPITLYPGAAFDVPFTSIVIENTAQPGASLRLVYGTDIAFRPANAAGVSILNAISVIDAAAQRSLAGLSYMGKATVTASAVNLSCAQLWNPGGTGKNVIVENVTGNSSTGTYELRFTLDNAAQAATAGATFNNKLASVSAVGAAQVRLGNPAAQTGTEIFRDQALANTRMGLVKSSSPIVLPPGFGLNVFSGAVNFQIYADFEWYEQPA